MSPTAEQLFHAVLALPDDDRFALMEALFAFMQPGDKPPFDDSWREVIQRRFAELRSGKILPLPWSEVKRQARL